MGSYSLSVWKRKATRIPNRQKILEAELLISCPLAGDCKRLHKKEEGAYEKHKAPS